MKWKNMSNDEKKDWIETVLGGLFGVIAIIATFCEYWLGNNDALAGMIKDVFGTAVVVVLLFAAIPHRKTKNLASLLKQRVEKWGEDNAPMIFQVEGYVCAKGQNYTQGFALLQNPRKYVELLELKKGDPAWHTYANYTSKQTGKFLDLPAYEEMTAGEFEIRFVLGQKHFKEIEGISDIIKNIADATTKRFAAKNVKAECSGNSGEIKVKFNAAIESKKDIEDFVSVIDFVLSLVKVIA